MPPSGFTDALSTHTHGTPLYVPTCLVHIPTVAEVVTLLIIHQIRSSLGGSDDNVEAIEEHKQ